MVNKVQRLKILNIQKLPHKNQFKYKRKVNIEFKNCEKYSSDRRHVFKNSDNAMDQISIKTPNPKYRLIETYTVVELYIFIPQLARLN
jgi:hypothetical protein